MTIHGLGYRPASYEPTRPLTRALALSMLEFRSLFKTIWGILLYVLCVFPSIVRLILMMIWLGVIAFGPREVREFGREAGRRAPDELRGFVPTNVEFYVDQIVSWEQGFAMFLLLTVFTTARGIAKDRATNAQELYWTRGISPFGYFLAKWFGSFLLVATMTVASPVLLWLVGVLFADDWTFLHETVGFMPRAVLGLLVFTVIMTAICSLLSAIVGSANLAMISWCLLLGGSTAVGHVASEMLNRRVLEHWSVWDAAMAVARATAGMPQRADAAAAATSLAVLFALLALLVRRRLRVVEAVG